MAATAATSTIATGQRGLAARPPSRVFRPNSVAQARCLLSEAPTVYWSSRFFGGKTFAICLKAYVWAARHPGAHVAVVREEHAAVMRTTAQTFRNEVIPPELASWRGTFGWKESESALYLPKVQTPKGPRQSVVYFVGVDRPERILSAAFSLIVVDQAEGLDERQATLLSSRAGRQVGMPGQIIYVCNPDDPDLWLNQAARFDLGSREIYDDSGRLTAEVIVSGESDNLENANDGYRQRLQSLEGVYRERYLLGRWARNEGSVYGPVWNPDRHVVERPTEWAQWGGYPPPDWPRARSFDFGVRNPSVVLWFAKDRDGKWWTYREVYTSGWTASQLAEQVVALERQEMDTLRAHCTDAQSYAAHLSAFRCVSSYSDHDPNWRGELARGGVWTQCAMKDIKVGIGAVTDALKHDRLCFVRGALVQRDPELVRQKVPTSVVEEFAGYVWPQARPGSDASQQRLDIPVDQDNHGLDALRYHIASQATSRVARVWS